MKKHLFFNIIFFGFISSLTFALPFNSKLSEEENQKLLKGEVLIRNVDSIDDVCVYNIEGTSKILSVMEELDPAYVAEVIQVRPYKGNEDLIQRIDEVLMNIEDYVGIPYFSERTQSWYELYSSAEIKNIAENQNKKEIDCILEMSLFGKFNTKINTEKTDKYYYYSMKNMDKLVYHEKFTAVKPEKMLSCITIFRDGDNWILYSIGAVDTYKLFFIEDRVETSFMNRIKTFCNFIFSKI